MTGAEEGAIPAHIFAYHRSLSPMFAMLLGLAIAETIVIHIVAVALWGWTVALVLGAIDLGFVVLLVGVLRSFRRLPITLDDERLIMRAGTLKSLSLPREHIAGLRDGFAAADLKQRSVLNLALVAYPNVIVDLAQPVRGLFGRRITAIAHRLDDPAGFTIALTAARA